MGKWQDRILWLQAQAALAYEHDPGSGVAKVRRADGFVPPYQGQSLSAVFHSLPQLYKTYPALSGNLMARSWPHLPPQTIQRMDDFLNDHNYEVLEFFDHGGRAMVFRVRHAPTGHQLVLRVEGDHQHRQPRPLHSTVLQPLLTNQAVLDDFSRIKMEVLPEIIPLSKLPDRDRSRRDAQLSKIFNDAVVDLAWGTNRTYPKNWFDFDAEPQNVGMMPDGRVVTLDPEIFIGAKAIARRERFSRNYRDLPPDFLPLLYGVSP